MTSTFDDLHLVIQRYGFDVVTLSETWLKDNPQLLSHVSIPGYANKFRNRDKIKGGGIGAYIKEAFKSVLRILSAHNKVCYRGPTHWNFNLIKQMKFTYK